MRVTLRRISGSKALGAPLAWSLCADGGGGLLSGLWPALRPCGGIGASHHSLSSGGSEVLHAQRLGVSCSQAPQAGWGSQDRHIVFEVSNLRQAGDKTRPGDVVWLNFLGPGQHLLIDVSMTGVYRDAVLKDVCRIPGFAAKAVRGGCQAG